MYVQLKHSVSGGGAASALEATGQEMHVLWWTTQSLSSASQPVVRAPKSGELSGDGRTDLEIILLS